MLVAVFHRNELSFNQEYEAERGAFEMTMLQQKVRDGDTPSSARATRVVPRLLRRVAPLAYANQAVAKLSIRPVFRCLKDQVYSPDRSITLHSLTRE